MSSASGPRERPDPSDHPVPDPGADVSTPTTARTGTRPVLELRGVSKRYGAVQALSDVHLRVEPGRVHALLGENGAGKSTLMGVATGVTRPDTGEIVVQGEPVGTLTPTSPAAGASPSSTSTPRSCPTSPSPRTCAPPCPAAAGAGTCARCWTGSAPTWTCRTASTT